MKTEWDYTKLADAYMKRADYSSEVISEILEITQTKKGDKVCDIGAGTGHLTKLLLKEGLSVMAVEPNDAMRKNGMAVTEEFSDCIWVDGISEQTNQEENTFQLVTFGSSFNVADRKKALAETYRILKSGGWFACMWNHRQLDDPIQMKIEDIIKSFIPAYDYGTRREEQEDVIRQSGLFDDITKLEGCIVYKQTIEDCIIGWKSHATLERQAGSSFTDIIKSIGEYLNGLGSDEIEVPYKTVAWVAKAKK